jgi:hypothetical protein
MERHELDTDQQIQGKTSIRLGQASFSPLENGARKELENTRQI